MGKSTIWRGVELVGFNVRAAMGFAANSASRQVRGAAWPGAACRESQHFCCARAPHFGPFNWGDAGRPVTEPGSKGSSAFLAVNEFPRFPAPRVVTVFASANLWQSGPSSRVAHQIAGKQRAVWQT